MDDDATSVTSCVAATSLLHLSSCRSLPRLVYNRLWTKDQTRTARKRKASSMDNAPCQQRHIANCISCTETFPQPDHPVRRGGGELSVLISSDRAACRHR